MGFFAKRLARMTRGGIAGLIAVLSLASVGAFVWASWGIQTSPGRCATCHPQLTAMWERSKGHPADRVSCHQCHGQHAALPESANLVAYVRDTAIPVEYWSSETLIEARCQECHPQIRDAETEQAKIIKLNHKVHMVTGKGPEGEPLQMGCLDCHRNITHDKAQVETNRPRMAGCFVGECHRKDRNKDNCRRCHYQQLTEPGEGIL